jgi:hypothetical protein
MRRVREWIRGRELAIGALAVFALVSALVIPAMKADGTAQITAYDLNAGVPTPGLRTSGAVSRNVFGFVVQSFGQATVRFGVNAVSRPGSRNVLFISAGGGPDVRTEVTLIDGAGKRHPLGRPSRWIRHRVDVTSLAGTPPLRLEFSAANSGSEDRLFADQVRAATYPASAVPSASRGAVAIWVALGVLLVLAVARRIRRDAPSIHGGALEPQFSDIWDSAVRAKWFDLDQGLVSGTFGEHSALGVQLFHALTPITGTGAVGSRTAALLVGVGALAVIYALARRVAGPIGAVAALACVLLSDPFRAVLERGDSTGTLVLASALFLLATHHVLLRGDRTAMVLLGAAGALAILAEPTWWPGVVAAIVLLALRYAAVPARLALGSALLALVLLSLPARVSVAHQAAGDVNADVIRRATFARNVEYVGRGHGAPPDRAALAANTFSGPQVGLGDYLVGDHSLSLLVGGTLSGAYDAQSATADRPHAGVAGLIAFIAEIAGIVFLLMLPRLRLLVIVPAMLAVVPWFFVSRNALPSFAGNAAFFPAMVIGAAALVYIAAQVVRHRLGDDLGLSVLSARAPLLRRLRRDPEPG